MKRPEWFQPDCSDQRIPSENIEQKAVDVVLFSSLICGVLAVPLERLLRDSGVKTVAIAHGLDALWSFPPYQWTLERAFTRLDAVVAVSAATGQTEG